MVEPRSRGPAMPGYGRQRPGQGTALLPWAGAEERLIASPDDRVVTLWPHGRPHAMPVYPADFVDPAVNATALVRPGWAFGLAQEDFAGSPAPVGLRAGWDASRQFRERG